MRSAPYQVVIGAAEPGGVLDLRASSEIASRVARMIGTRLPAKVGHIERLGALVILNLGPDHWLLRVPHYYLQKQYDRLERAIEQGRGMVTDVSDAYIVLSIEGDGIIDILAQGCPLDFDLSAFPIGTYASSVLARCAVLLIRRAAGFDLLVDRTYADYIRQWLHAAAGSDTLKIFEPSE